MLGVKLVIGGGPGTINIINDTIKAGMPVIIFNDTSQAALLLAYAYDLTALNECNLMQIEEHQKLVELIGKEYPDLTLKNILTFYNSIMECMKNKLYVSMKFHAINFRYCNTYFVNSNIIVHLKQCTTLIIYLLLR